LAVYLGFAYVWWKVTKWAQRETERILVDIEKAVRVYTPVDYSIRIMPEVRVPGVPFYLSWLRYRIGRNKQLVAYVVYRDVLGYKAPSIYLGTVKRFRRNVCCYTSADDAFKIVMFILEHEYLHIVLLREVSLYASNRLDWLWFERPQYFICRWCNVG